MPKPKQSHSIIEEATHTRVTHTNLQCITVQWALFIETALYPIAGPELWRVDHCSLKPDQIPPHRVIITIA